jgi:hypothetical protein
VPPPLPRGPSADGAAARSSTPNAQPPPADARRPPPRDRMSASADGEAETEGAPYVWTDDVLEKVRLWARLGRPQDLCTSAPGPLHVGPRTESQVQRLEDRVMTLEMTEQNLKLEMDQMRLTHNSELKQCDWPAHTPHSTGPWHCLAYRAGTASAYRSSRSSRS